MVTQSNIHFFTNWAKERLDEMDATVTSLEGKAAEVQADVRDKAKKVLAAPLLDDDGGFLQAVEDLSAEQFIAQFCCDIPASRHATAGGRTIVT